MKKLQIHNTQTLETRFPLPVLFRCLEFLSLEGDDWLASRKKKKKPDLFHKQSGHFGSEFDESDNPVAPSQQSPFSGALSHGRLGLCY